MGFDVDEDAAREVGSASMIANQLMEQLFPAVMNAFKSQVLVRVGEGGGGRGEKGHARVPASMRAFRHACVHVCARSGMWGWGGTMCALAGGAA